MNLSPSCAEVPAPIPSPREVQANYQPHPARDSSFRYSCVALICLLLELPLGPMEEKGLTKPCSRIAMTSCGVENRLAAIC